ncbi:Uncharacterised protein [Leclercia adecarboxylata]|uniref:Uncharacterized protein n=1 Tax=Leclercia adecarboxylata TaxID=83655 RepID=A0A4V6JM11_9ENTR|nr:Uncharacterised protein [Leclercia adecarboxylata]
MSELYLKWMDRLYLLAMAVAGLSLLVMTIVDPDWHLFALRT